MLLYIVLDKGSDIMSGLFLFFLKKLKKYGNKVLKVVALNNCKEDKANDMLISYSCKDD